MPELPIREPIKIPPDVKRTLEDLQVTLDRAYKELDTMKRLGMDTSMLKDKLDWAAEVRKTLLTEFS